MAKKRRGQKKPRRLSSIYVVVDYPQEGEVLIGPDYTIRIGASEKGSTEVSIDGGEWKKCRMAEGFWWYDWKHYPPGPHTIAARLVNEKGRVLRKSSVRNCTYHP